MVTSAPTVVAFPEAEVDLSDAFLRGLPTNATRTAYRQALAQLRVFMGDRSLLTATRRDIEAFRAHLEALGRSPLTISKLLSGLSGFFAFALDEGAVNRNPVVKARRPKLPQTSPRQALSHTEVHALLTAPDQSKLIGLRDFAFISVLAVQGFRLAETLHLSVGDNHRARVRPRHEGQQGRRGQVDLFAVSVASYLLPDTKGRADPTHSRSPVPSLGDHRRARGRDAAPYCARFCTAQLPGHHPPLRRT